MILSIDYDVNIIIIISEDEERNLQKELNMEYKLTIEMFERKTNNLVHTYTSKFSTKLEAYINAVELANALSSDFHYYKYRVEEIQ